MHIYERLKAAGVPLDSHESDLYAMVTPVSREIVLAYLRECEHAGVTQFLSKVDGQIWYDIPFAYLPYWKDGSLETFRTVHSTGESDATSPDDVKELDYSLARPSFYDELRALLNKHNAEASSKTPDFVLADYLCLCLGAFNANVVARDQWYEIVPEPGKDNKRS